jgi:carbonic anhydrase
LGLKPGDAKILRNAGGRVTPDVIRSLAIAVATLGVRSIVVMHHTECAMSSMSNDGIARAITKAGGSVDEDLDFLAMDDRRASLINDVEAIRQSTLIPSIEVVVGWIYDVRTGTIEEVIES